MIPTAGTQVGVRVRWEGAHRLPRLSGKCENLHGHSWQAWAVFSGPVNPDGVVVDFGALKADIQAWVDDHLDHATMLGQGDPLTFLLEKFGQRLYVFGVDPFTTHRAWPTVENVAHLLHQVATRTAASLGVRVESVTVAETENNRATVVRADDEVTP